MSKITHLYLCLFEFTIRGPFVERRDIEFGEKGD